MINFGERALNNKEQHIKNMYSPLKFQDEIQSEKIEKCVTKEEKATKVMHILFNCTKSNATERAVNPNKYDRTKNNRGRTYYDAYRLCMHYCPEITFKEMYHILVKGINASHGAYLKRMERQRGIWYYTSSKGFWTCSTIGRARFCGNYKIKF